MSAGAITIELLAGTGSFEAGIDKAKQSLGEFQQATDKAAGSTAAGAASDAEAAKQLAMLASGYETSRAAIERFAQSQSAAAEAASNAADSSRASYAAGVAMGAATVEAGHQIKDWFESTVGWVENKVKVIVIGLAIAAVSAAAGAIYTAYHLIKGAINFITGLFSGESYKSESIDALIELNDKIMEIQKNLHISSQEAQALLSATSRLGVKPETVTKVRGDAVDAQRSNTDELDRLGVTYKDANGQLLEQDTFLKNVKKSLDEYTEGWDRNKAAVAIGVGSYQDITDVLKVNKDEVEKSRLRLVEYNLTIGPETQKAVALYQQTMRDFNSETELMGQAFSRIFADALMPALTDLAEFFKDGWPKVVGAVRVGVASIVALFYAMKDGIYIVAESVLASLESLGIAFVALRNAAVLVGSGDVTGAADTLAKGWELGAARVKQAGENIVKQVMDNNAKIQMAFGLDEQNTPIGATPKGKTFVETPKKPPAEQDPDALLKKQLAGEVQAYEANAKLVQDAIAFKNQYLAGEYQAGLASQESFFKAEGTLRDQALATTVESIDKQIAAQKKYAEQFAKPENVQGAQNAIAKLEAERTAAVKKAGQDNQLAHQKEAADVLSLTKSYEQLRSTILGLQGDKKGAGQIGIDQQVQDAQRLINQAANLPAVPRLKEGPEATQLRAGLEGQLALSKVQEDYNKLLMKQRDLEELIAITAESGGATEEQTLKALGKARSDALKQLDEMVLRANELALSLGTPEAIKQAEELGQAYKRAAAVADPMLTRMREQTKAASDALYSSLGSELEDALGGHFDSIGMKFAKMLQDMVFKAIAADLMSAITGGKSGAGGNTSSLWGGIANAIGAMFGGSSGGGSGAGGAGYITNEGSFAVGTNYVPRDMTAQLHKGEAVVPAAYNPANGGGQMNVTVENHGADVRTQKDNSGNMRIIVRNLLREEMSSDLASGGPISQQHRSVFGLSRQLPRRG